MLPLLTDNGFRAPIVRALRRLSPGADIVSAHEIGMALAPDEELLAQAAEHGRVPLTHDARTMPPTHYRRIAEGLNPPRLILVVQSMPIGMAAEELLLVLDAATHGDWRSNYIRLPLQYQPATGRASSPFDMSGPQSDRPHMPTTLTDVRDRIRKDLHDTDSASYRWTDAQLDRHTDHALSELSAAMPLEKSATLATTAGSRDLSLVSLTDLVDLDTVEYPIGDFPPSYPRFASWSTTLTLQTDTPPTGANARVYYVARHVLDGSGTTLSAFQVDVLVTGAAAYAALEQSAYTADRITTGGTAVPERFEGYARARLTAFHQLLLQYGRKNRLRARRAYVPA